MSENTNTKPEEGTENLTPEEIQELKQKQLDYYNDQMPHLKAALEYERLVADIEEARLKYYTMRMRIGQLLAPPKPAPQETPEEEDAPRKERKLKTQA